MTTQTSEQSGTGSAGERASAVGSAAQEQAGQVAGTAKEQAGQVAGTAKEQATQVAGTAKEQALEVAGEAKAQARDLVGEVRGQVQEQVGTQRDRLVQLLREFGDDLENLVDGKGGTEGPAAEIIRQVSTRLRGVQSYVEGGDSGTPADVLSDVRRLARRRPAAFIAGAAALGLVAGRATRSAAAARKAQSEPAGGRHAVGSVDVRESYGYETGTGYASGTDYGYRTEGYGTSAAAPLSGVERTSDPNLAPTSGPYTTATGAILSDPDGPVTTDPRGRDTGTGSRGYAEGTGTGFEGTR